MDTQGRSLRIGAMVLMLAVALRLYSIGAFDVVCAALENETVASFVLYLETGRVLRHVPAGTMADETEPETVPETGAPEKEPVTFTAADADLIYIRGTSNRTVDAAALLETPLDLDLTGDGPTVLILHTHATESYTQTAGSTYTESSEFRTLDCDHNMTAIGARVAELLEAAGIQVIHSDELHDYPSYNGSYANSRQTAQAILAQYPSIQLVLDIHRDAAVDSDGSQYDTSAQVNGQESAQILLLMSGGHDGWAENMALAVKLAAQLEKMYPGISRGIITRNSVYNQDLSGGAMLVEVGSAGNTLEESMTAAEALAQAIIALASGTR